MVSDIDTLARLLAAYAAGDNIAFNRAAEFLIQELTARNRHAEAKTLQQALERTNGTQNNFGTTLLPLPRNRREGENLITIVSRPVEADRVFLCRNTKDNLDRLLLEQKRRRLLEKHGLKPKAKLLFWGPPGCGKTLTAQLIGTELNLPVGLVRLSALVTSYVGETAANLQRVFNAAAATPMVLLLDEVDTLAKDRDDRNDVGELKRVVNSLLQAVDLFPADKSILVAASNHQYLLDEAVWRRFDDVIEFPLPDKMDRARFLRHLLSGVVFSGAYETTAQQLSGLSFADIETVAYDAIKTMVLHERDNVCAQDLSPVIRAFREKRRRARARAKG